MCKENTEGDLTSSSELRGFLEEVTYKIYAKGKGDTKLKNQSEPFQKEVGGSRKEASGASRKGLFPLGEDARSVLMVQVGEAGMDMDGRHLQDGRSDCTDQWEVGRGSGGALEIPALAGCSRMKVKCLGFQQGFVQAVWQITHLSFRTWKLKSCGTLVCLMERPNIGQ